jgi:hypothetical protein
MELEIIYSDMKIPDESRIDLDVKELFDSGDYTVCALVVEQLIIKWVKKAIVESKDCHCHGFHVDGLSFDEFMRKYLE